MLNTISPTLQRYLQRCPECEGNGEITTVSHYGLSGMQAESTRDCPECEGEGCIAVEDD